MWQSEKLYPKIKPQHQSYNSTSVSSPTRIHDSQWTYQLFNGSSLLLNSSGLCVGVLLCALALAYQSWYVVSAAGACHRVWTHPATSRSKPHFMVILQTTLKIIFPQILCPHQLFRKRRTGPLQPRLQRASPSTRWLFQALIIELFRFEKNFKIIECNHKSGWWLDGTFLHEPFGVSVLGCLGHSHLFKLPPDTSHRCIRRQRHTLNPINCFVFTRFHGSLMVLIFQLKVQLKVMQVSAEDCKFKYCALQSFSHLSRKTHIGMGYTRKYFYSKINVSAFGK